MTDTRTLAVRSVSEGDFDALHVTNGMVDLTLVPDLGGKIASLRDRRTGREWLWRSDTLPLRTHPYGTSYVREADTGGWDECFPTVAPCTYPLPPFEGKALPDHGEVWSQAWPTRVAEEGGELVLHSSARGVALPYHFERRVRLREGQATLRFEYEVTNEGEHDLAFIWSAHPLLRLEPGMRLHLPGEARWHVYYKTDATHLPPEPLVWPFPVQAGGRPVPLDPLPDAGAGVAFKVWSGPLTGGWAALGARDGTLRFRFDPREVPQLGVWLNGGGWSGTGGAPYHNLALEPCIGAQDALADAVEKFGQYALLPAHGTRRWSMDVELLDREMM